MWRSPKPRFDVAASICQGGCDYQKDAIVTDSSFGTDTGVVVLSDGMGGHAAGDVASKLIVTNVYGELARHSAKFVQQEKHLPDLLNKSGSEASESLRGYIQANPRAKSMGATLVSLVLVENRPFYISIGDSPLDHLRGGTLRRLNEDHSSAPQIDYMVDQGPIDKETAQHHPDRNCLTSAIIGDDIARKDCPETPVELMPGDVVVVSSDGLKYLEEKKIQTILHKYLRRPSAEIAGQLLETIETLADPDQDNVSVAVIKLNQNKPMERAIAPKPIDVAVKATGSSTRIANVNEPAMGKFFWSVRKPVKASAQPVGNAPGTTAHTEEAAHTDKKSTLKVVGGVWS